MHPVLTDGIGESIILFDCNLDGDVLDERRGKPFRNRYRYKRKLINRGRENERGKCGEKESDEEKINEIEEERSKEKNVGERLMER